MNVICIKSSTNRHPSTIDKQNIEVGNTYKIEITVFPFNDDKAYYKLIEIDGIIFISDLFAIISDIKDNMLSEEQCEDIRERQTVTN